jgi:hypothetical protein
VEIGWHMVASVVRADSFKSWAEVYPSGSNRMDSGRRLTQTCSGIRFEAWIELTEF